MRLKKYVYLILLIGFAVMLCACRKQDPDIGDPDPAESPTPTMHDTVTIAPVISGGRFNLVAKLIYTVDADTSRVVRSTVMVRDDTDITPALVIDFIVDSLKDESLNLSFDGIEYEDGVCVVDFDDSIYTIAGKSADLEDAILDCIAQSVLDNVDGCMSVIYRIHNEAYSTVNRHFAYDFVYME
ncbi:MAG: hypothetical protein II694_06505 [Lachnospiraceae bacterium]|nr:hypothetical protein [Lachnospiraceae bacterium]